LSQFRFVLFNALKQWSIEYKSGLNSINWCDPQIDLSCWTDGYNFARSNIKITSTKRGNKITYLILLGNENFDEPDQWSSFSDYEQSLNTVHTSFKYPVTTANWRQGECDCSGFLKNYVCHHLIGIVLRLKCVNASIEAKTIPIGQKRKRGRLAKSRPALERQ